MANDPTPPIPYADGSNPDAFTRVSPDGNYFPPNFWHQNSCFDPIQNSKDPGSFNQDLNEVARTFNAIRPTLAEMQQAAGEVAKLVSQRTSDKEAEIRREHENVQWITDILRYALQGKPHNLSHANQLIGRVASNLDKVHLKLKARYNCARPYQLDGMYAQIDPLFVMGNPSFPGGHASSHMMVVLLLEKLYAANSNGKLTQAGKDQARREVVRIAVNREIAGVHTSQDTCAGFVLARHFVEHLFSKSDFPDEFRYLVDNWKSD
jgi:hypothetical protein